jgi:hypothetical protein
MWVSWWNDETYYVWGTPPMEIRRDKWFNHENFKCWRKEDKSDCYSQHDLPFLLCEQGLQNHVLFWDILSNSIVSFNGLCLFIVLSLHWNQKLFYYEKGNWHFYYCPWLDKYNGKTTRTPMQNVRRQSSLFWNL